jgi:hypothetical protein
MQTEALQTPVALFIFKRPHTTALVFNAISKVRPAKLLLIADGPRQDREGEAEACRQVLDIVARVDWPCEVFKNFSQRNLGCGERMISGLNWVFSLVEEAIVLEDDCLPDLSFFTFCQELLERYRGDHRIAYISGDNLAGKHKKLANSYYYSQIAMIWGWATWRPEWLRYDRHLSDWPEIKKQRILEEIFDEPRTVRYWTRVFEAMHAGSGPDTWDFQWLYTALINNSLAIVPAVNLVTNLGFGDGATHTLQEDRSGMIPASSMEFPLRHPPSFNPLRSLDRRRMQGMVPRPIPLRILNKFMEVAGRVSRRLSTATLRSEEDPVS